MYDDLFDTKAPLAKRSPHARAVAALLKPKPRKTKLPPSAVDSIENHGHQVADAFKPPPKKVKVITEHDVEESHRVAHEQDGGLMPKFTSPARRSVPDRLKFSFIPPEHREIVARYFRLIEFKRPGVKPSASQVREHERFQALGFVVDVIDQPLPKRKP